MATHGKTEIDRFTRFLVYKSIQVIVQSRLGDKVKTESKPSSSGTDWFNLGIKDISGVLQETKKVLSGQQLSCGKTFCLEISLKTAENETMALETWYISMLEDVGPVGRVSYTIYNRMSLLLKSLLCVTRATPAYKLSRKQGPDKYVICYRLYIGEPQLSFLGSNAQHISVGSVPMPTGTVVLRASCRTQMLISPHSSCDVAPDLKVDHFRSDASPKRCTTPKPCQGNRDSPQLVEGSVVNEESQCMISFSTSPYEVLQDNFGISPSASPKGSHRVCSADPIKIQRKKSTDSIDGPTSVPDKEATFKVRYGAFAPAPHTVNSDTEEVPFSLLFEPKANTKGTGQKDADLNLIVSEDKKDVGTGSEHVKDNSLSNSPSTGPDEQDFVLIELKAPFAGSDVNSDIGQFYKECQAAPSLSMFEDSGNTEDTLDEITTQLAVYESTLIEFDDFVESLQTEG